MLKDRILIFMASDTLRSVIMAWMEYMIKAHKNTPNQCKAKLKMCRLAGTRVTDEPARVWYLPRQISIFCLVSFFLPITPISDSKMSRGNVVRSLRTYPIDQPIGALQRGGEVAM